MRARSGDDAALVVVFSCGQPDPAAVLAGVDEVFPGVPLIGCSAQSVIASDGLDGPGDQLAIRFGHGAESVERTPERTGLPPG